MQRLRFPIARCRRSGATKRACAVAGRRRSRRRPRSEGRRGRPAALQYSTAHRTLPVHPVRAARPRIGDERLQRGTGCMAANAGCDHCYANPFTSENGFDLTVRPNCWNENGRAVIRKTPTSDRLRQKRACCVRRIGFNMKAARAEIHEVQSVDEAPRALAESSH